MTEKRFTYGNSDKGIALADELKYEHYYWLSSEDCKDIVDLLNELSEENEQLRLDNKRLLSDYTDVCNDNVALENENEQLKSENKNLKFNVDDLMNMELEDRDIVCQAGKFRLEEWGKHRLHQFYDEDTPLEDETVVIRLMDLTTENEQLKSDCAYRWKKYCNTRREMLHEIEQLKSEIKDLNDILMLNDENNCIDRDLYD